MEKATIVRGSRPRNSLLLFVLALTAWTVSPSASAQRLAGAALVDAIAQGGYVLVIRNARSPRAAPENGDRSPANLDGEREIDEHGQGQMSVIGYALRELRVPVATTLSGSAYRSRQSAKYLGFGEQRAVATLGEAADPSWLADRVAEAPPAGQNTVIVTHGSLITAAFGRDARNVEQAETLIFEPGDGAPRLVARLSVEDWARLAVE